MTSSPKGEGGISQNMTNDDMMTKRLKYDKISDNEGLAMTGDNTPQK